MNNDWELLSEIPEANVKCSLCVVQTHFIYCFFEENSRYYKLDTRPSKD